MSAQLKQNIASVLQQFNSTNTKESAIHLFEAFGYNTSRRLSLSNSNYQTFKDEFGIDPQSGFNEKNALVNEWQSIHLLFQLTADEMKAQAPLFEPTVERNEPASFLFFAIRLTGQYYSRTQLSAIAREINKPFKMDVFVVFHYGDHLTLSLIERRPNQRVLDRDVMQKVTHVYNIYTPKPHAAHVHILYSFSFEAIEAESRKKRIQSFKELQLGWKKVVSTQVLNSQFYREYQSLSKDLIRAIQPQQPNKMLAHQGVLNLLNRIMFVYFVQKKNWIMNDDQFMIHFWQAYNNHGHRGSDTFHKQWLNPLFFAAFNGQALQQAKAIALLPDPYNQAMLAFPYLNGGLFSYNKELDNFLLDDGHFENIFDFFERYIFTIAEDTPYDVNLEINPELLGKMYEGMINATDLDDVDAEHGIVYTERPEINFMARRSLVEVLDKKLGGAISREGLYHIVFDTDDEKTTWLQQHKAQLPALRQAICSLTACDPSCGSGSMLLGVISVQMELLRSIDALQGQPHTAKDDFVIKKQLISDCIYGVDIKEWAVRIAELRLWLYMIAEAEFTPAELTKAPLLPNLDFKLRCGNSLLQKFGDLDFTLEELFKGRKKSAGAARPLNDYIKKKKAFIQNQAAAKTSYDQLKQEEKAVFLDLLQEMIIDKEQQIQSRKKRLTQGSMFGTAKQPDMFADELAQLQAEHEQLKAVRQQIHKQKRLPFSYDIDFMEVFAAKEGDERGFDLIIGNPPYVRQEEILPPEDAVFLEKLMLPANKALKKKVNAEYKELLTSRVYKVYPWLASTVSTVVNGQNKTLPVYGKKVPGRSDLYVYFQLLCPHYLNSKGTFCFIISNSWLDVEFGSYVQQFLLKHTQLKAVYDCNVRSFEAAVNTIIYLHGPVTNEPVQRSSKYNLVEPIAHTTRFIMNKVDFATASYSKLMIEQEATTANSFTESYRCIPMSQTSLYENGYDPEAKIYVGDKWGGKLLRAPEIYYTILEKGKHLFKALKDIADIDYGIKTGANEFFYIDKNTASEFGLEKRFLKTVFKSPKDTSTIEINMDSLETLLFSSSSPKEELKGTNALEYINWGEKSEIINGTEVRLFNERPSCSNRELWYQVPINRGNTFWGKELRERLCVFSSSKPIVADCRLYMATMSIEQQAILNSTFSVFIDEVLSRQLGGGGGPRSVMVYEVKNLTTIDADLIKEKDSLVAAFNKLKIRNILPFLEEIGLSGISDIRSQPPNPLPDRAALDKVVFDALGLTDEERNEVYWSVAELVQQRLNKAASR